MDDLDVAIYLLQQAKEEKQKYINYTNMYDAAYALEDQKERNEAYVEISKQFKHIPTKQVPNDKIKLARRLLTNCYL